MDTPHKTTLPETEVIKSTNIDHCIGLKYRVSATSFNPFSIDHSYALAAMCDQAVSYEVKNETQSSEQAEKQSAVTQYGEECAGTITSEFDGMPCPDRGPSAVAIGVFNTDGNKAGAETDMSGGSPSILSQHGTDPRAVELEIESIGVSFDGRKDMPMLNECSQTETVGTKLGHKIGVAIGFKAGQSANGGLGLEEENCPTLSHQPSALEPTVVYPINGMVLGKDTKDGDRQTTGIGSDGDRQTTGIGSENDPCPAIQTQHHHAVAQINSDSKTMDNLTNFDKQNSDSNLKEAVGFSHIASGVMLDCTPKNTATTIKACAVGEGATIVGVDGYNQTITGGASPTLSGAASDFHHTHGVIAEGIDPYNMSSTKDAASTIGVNCGISTGRNGVAIAIEGNGSRPSHLGNGFSGKEVSFTLNRIEQHGVAIGMKYLASEKSKAPISVEHAQALAAGCPDSAVAYESKNAMGITEGAHGVTCTESASSLQTGGGKPGQGYQAVAIGCDRRNQTGFDEVQPTLQSTVSDGGSTCSIGINAEPGNHDQSYPVECANSVVAKHKEGVMTEMEPKPMPLTHIVRRLTVTECERLMGFPDNYTKIPYRNKPAEACPDSPRYKALGNSWATNCAEWVLRRIVQAIKEGRA